MRTCCISTRTQIQTPRTHIKLDINPVLGGQIQSQLAWQSSQISDFQVQWDAVLKIKRIEDTQHVYNTYAQTCTHVCTKRTTATTWRGKEREMEKKEKRRESMLGSGYKTNRSHPDSSTGLEHQLVSNHRQVSLKRCLAVLGHHYDMTGLCPLQHTCEVLTCPINLKSDTNIQVWTDEFLVP